MINFDCLLDELLEDSGSYLCLSVGVLDYALIRCQSLWFLNLSMLWRFCSYVGFWIFYLWM